MAGKITELAANSAAATGDLIETVDISDTSMAASGTNKKLALSDLVTWLNANGISGGGAATGTKMTALTALTGALMASTDIVEIVDVSDTTMAASGTNKKMTMAELAIFLQATLQFGNSGSLYKFNWSSTTTAPPATSEVRYNNATAASVTSIYVSYTSKDTTDLKTRLLVGVAGDRLFLQDRDNSTKYQIYTLSGTPTDNTTYATVPVTYLSGGTALVNGDEILAGFIEAPASETYLGIVELATAAETTTGTDNTRAVHPAGAAAVYVPRLTSSLINAQTGTTYTLVLADNQKLLTLNNASAIALTVPTNASVPFPIGAQIDIAQLGVGRVTVSSGGTINATPGLNLRAQYSGATLTKLATDTWLMVGDLA